MDPLLRYFWQLFSGTSPWTLVCAATPKCQIHDRARSHVQPM